MNPFDVIIFYYLHRPEICNDRTEDDHVDSSAAMLARACDYFNKSELRYYTKHNRTDNCEGCTKEGDPINDLLEY